MAFATIQQVKNETSFEEIRTLSESSIEMYIEYANAYLRRVTGVNYRDETDPDILTDLKRVTILLVEYLWLGDQPEVKESNFTGVSSERIGSYSYNVDAKDGTGHAELDQLLISLTPRYSVGNFFSVHGPSRVKNQLDVKHAYVTRLYEN